FEALNKAKLRLRMDKCEFGVDQIEYLGFRIGKESRCPTKAKVEKIKSLPAPKCKKELDSFIGVAGQYRELIERFSEKAQPLFELKKHINNKGKFFWSDEHERSFSALKEELTRPPVVRLPDTTKPFIVKTDASGTGMGAVLLQEFNGQRHVIQYASRQFKGPQLNYPTIEKEATAIMFALNKWQHFLLHGNFILETDHRPLQFINSMKDSRGKLARMAIRLNEFQPF